MFLSKRKYNELLEKISSVDNKITAIDMVRTYKENGEYLPVITKESTPPLSDDEKKKVAYALNLCTVSVSQIIDYNDIYILEQEYDAILNNLNLQNFIKDESLLKVLKQMLDTITFFKIQEGDKKFIEKEYQHKMKNAIWSAVPNLSIIFAGGNPISMAITAAAQIGIGYMNYRKNKSQYILDREKQEWELQRSAIEQFNGLRRELFETAWRLSDAYDFDDKYRLTEKQITRYNAILLDPDPLRRFEKLDVISDTFRAFPPFWYFKGNTAKDICRSGEYKDTEIGSSFKQKAIESYCEFNRFYVKFMREDVIAASCALEHVSLLDPEKDTEDIKKLLGRAIELAGDNFDVLQMCVLDYVALNQITDAKTTLQRLVNEEYNIGLNGLLLSRIYCKHDKNKTEYDILKKRIGETNVMPWIESDIDADRGYIEYKKKDVVWRFDKYLDDLISKYENIFEQKVFLEFVQKAIINPYEGINWFNNTDTVRLLIDILNQFFLELTNSSLFSVQQHPSGKSWNDFFVKKSDSVTEMIKKYNKYRVAVEEYISKHEIHDFWVNHTDNLASLEKIKALLSGWPISIFTEKFTKELKAEFNNSFTVKTAESADLIINQLDSWYVENKLDIPINGNLIIDNSTDKTMYKTYFVYDEIIEGRKNNGNITPVE
jgi:hypothetical protein